MARRSAFGRLLDHFHTHPRGRLHEFLFWTGIGVLLALGVWFGHRAGIVATAFLWMGLVIAGCFFLWALLPHAKPKAQAETPAGRLRAQKAAAVRASKEEGRRAKAAKRGGR